MNSVRLMTCESSFEAHLIKGRLENEGIPCFLTNENISGLLPNFFHMLGAGVQVMVDEEDLAKAREIIEPDKPEELICPNCGSKNIRFGMGKNRTKKWMALFFSLLAWVPFNNINNSYSCKDCGNDFKM